MTAAEEVREGQVSEQARRSRGEQGLPPGVEDEAALARVAELLRADDRESVRPASRR